MSHRLMAGIAATMAALVVLATAVSAAGPAGPEQAKLFASDATTEVGFGVSVAISGDTALVSSIGVGPMSGAEGQPSIDLGSVYVFVRTGTVWTEQAKLTASDAVEGARFGSSIAIFGNTALIGAWGDDDGGTDSGSAYLFRRTGTTWTEQAKLTATDAAQGDRFGSSVAISGDIALIAADSNIDARSGSVYVFTRPGIGFLTTDPLGGRTWSEETKLTASDAAAGDRFGSSVAISENTALIGAEGNDDAGADSGSAYVFRRTGTTWTQLDKLTASDADAAAGDRFGSSVAISGDTALIGAPSGPQPGTAYVFTGDVGPMGGSTSWTQRAKLTASDAAPSARFGLSVAISGNTAVVGAWFGDAASNSPGSAHVFTRVGSSWTEQTKLTASFAAGAEGVGFSERFGSSVAISGDTAIIGSGLDDDVAFNSGAAYVFVPQKPCETSKRSPDSSHRVKVDEKAQQDCRPRPPTERRPSGR